MRSTPVTMISGFLGAGVLPFSRLLACHIPLKTVILCFRSKERLACGCKAVLLADDGSCLTDHALLQERQRFYGSCCRSLNTR